jgi:hypothetical protein
LRLCHDAATGERNSDTTKDARRRRRRRRRRKRRKGVFGAKRERGGGEGGGGGGGTGRSAREATLRRRIVHICIYNNFTTDRDGPRESRTIVGK